MTYWQRRQKEQLKALEKSEKALMQRLTAYYRDEYAKLDKEIASFYSKYGVKKIIEYRMLLEDLSPQDRSLLMKNVEEFKEKYPNLKHIVPVRENIYKLNRLEGLQLSIIMQQAEIGAVNEQAVRRHLENLALKNANSVAELLGFGKNFYFENSDIIKNFVGVKWCNGKDFSQRIWENTDKLARYLTTDLAQGFARGESYEKLTTQIGKRFIDVAKRDIYRLVYTEGTYIMAESSAKPFEENFENYRLSTVGDGKVCPICTSVAENVFRFADREPGVNFPPLHPMCRCTFEIVVDDWNKWLDDYEKKHSDSGKQLMNRLNSDKSSDIILNESKQNKKLTFQTFDNGDEVNNFFYYDDEKRGLLAKKNSIYGKWKSNLTAEQNSAIVEYTTSGYSDLNNFLRKCGNWKELDADAMIDFRDNLRTVINTFELKKPIKVYRFTGRDSFKETNLVDLAGKEWIDKGFVSTSPTIEGIKNAVVTGKDVIIEISIPAGKGYGAYINELSPWKDKEYEFLLKDGLKYYITDVDISGEKPIVRMVIK